MEDKEIFEIDIEQPYDYAKRLSPLERMLYEDCHYEKGRIYVLRENYEERPAYLRLESLTRKFQMEPKEAYELREYLEELDATKEMVDTFALWTRRRGKENALEYFRKLSENVKQATATQETDALSLEQRLAEEESFEAFIYQPLGEPLEPVIPWEKRQPPAYRALLRRIERTPYERLPELGKGIYQDDKLTREQKAVAFDTYQRRKLALEQQAKRFASPGARTLLEKIREASDKDIPRLGIYLYHAQKNGADLSPLPRQNEWNFLWAAYHARRQENPS